MYGKLTSLVLVLHLAACSSAPIEPPPIAEEPNAATEDGGLPSDAIAIREAAVSDEVSTTDAAPSDPVDTGSPDAIVPGEDTAETKPDAADAADAADVAPGCGVAPDEPPATPKGSPPSDAYPMVRHWEQPKTPNTVALTFDDGPNPETTNRILDTLATEKIRATFFLNSRATLDLRTSSEGQKTLLRVIESGHVIGNHTGQHYDLSNTSTDVEAQLKLVEDDLKAVAPCAPPLTLVRAPFGEPYLSGTLEAQARVFPIVARHGVHIGWSIESRDWTCETATCVVDRVMERIDVGRRGSILLHDTQKVTADALPTLIAELRKRGVTFVTAEKLVRDKYGKPSAALLKK